MGVHSTVCNFQWSLIGAHSFAGRLRQLQSANFGRLWSESDVEEIKCYFTKLIRSEWI